MKDLLNRNLLVLFGGQVIFVSGTVVLVTIGGIVGHGLAPEPSMATLPVALMVVGTALTTIPAALTMQAIGRRLGFMFAALVGACGAGLAIWALAGHSFWLFCLATAMVGSSLGFSQQFRFAAAESVAPAQVSFAVSFILIGSIAGAVAAPEIVAYSALADPAAPYERAFLVMAGLYGLAMVIMLGLRPVALDATETLNSPARSLGEVAFQPMFVTAVLAGVVGQGVMTFVMTATPISMNVADGHSITHTSEVIRAHVIAMYLPSLVTPFLIRRFGLNRVMVTGLAAMALTLAIGLAGRELLHYGFALVLLGVGWNFLFVSGTTLLTGAYRASERFRSQAVNDFCVFGSSALASLLAGAMLHQLGWNLLLLSTLPVLVLMLMTLLWFRRRESTA